jgi:eukaryotic-like serine/threonine-protein kinase
MSKMKCPKCQHDNPQDTRFCGNCASPLATAAAERSSGPTETIATIVTELRTGTKFAGRFQVIEELGKGGMGRVYKAYDEKTREKIALKLLKPEIAADEQAIERFGNELRFARKISHRNVCRMYDLGEEKGTHFITMEYVPGENLKSIIRMMGPMSAGKTLHIARQVSEGLAEAHRLGVYHRDLKPQNIMIDREGSVRIMDFGIARSAKVKGLTGAGVVVGTPEYMAPEQFEGKEADGRSDIYALGVILYEMVTGRLPFEGETFVSIALKQKTEAPRQPKEFNPQIPDDLSRLILRCLERDREKRIQSVEDILADLAKIETGVPTTEKVLPSIPATSKQITVSLNPRKLIIPAVAVLVVIAAAVAFFIFKSPKSPKQVTPKKNKMLVVLPFENLGQPDDEYFSDGMTDEITNRLSALYGLDVISRATAVQYKKTGKTTRQIRDELNVDYILAGTVRWDKSASGKGRTRVTPQLVRATDDTQIWTKTYEQPLEDIFQVQSSIAEEVTKQLDITLLEPERKALFARPTENIKAYEIYLRAGDEYSRANSARDLQGINRAIELVEKAVQLDPNFVLVYVGLSSVHSSLYAVSGLDRTKERLAKSKAAVDRALELQPDSPEAKLALAYYYYRGFRDYDKSLELFEAVRKARPNLAPSLLGYIQRRQGKWSESLATLESIFKLDPRNSDLAYNICLSYGILRRFAEAEAWIDRSLALNPKHVSAISYKASLVYLRGNGEEAEAILKALPPGWETDETRFYYAMAERKFSFLLDRMNSPSFYASHRKELAFAGLCFAIKDIPCMRSHAEAARAIYEKLARENPEVPGNYASLGLAYAYLGRKDDALRAGNQAIGLLPISKDAYAGPTYEANQARILTIVGEYEQAIDKLEYLMSIPAGEDLSLFNLQKEPRWDPLRDRPRFKLLLEKYSKKS